uniref:Uncharacterized protein n=1 Tax=Parascaris univalens TaxID=6257 RepID=A0A915B218_PARUN
MTTFPSTIYFHRSELRAEVSAVTIQICLSVPSNSLEAAVTCVRFLDRSIFHQLVCLMEISALTCASCLNLYLPSPIRHQRF